MIMFHDKIWSDIQDYTGLNKEDVDYYRNLQDTGVPLLRDWQHAKPDTYEQIRWFYVGTNKYIFELATFGPPLSPPGDPERYIGWEEKPHGKILDFGGGIGTYSIELVFRGYDVDFLEINTLNRDFFRWRLRKYGLRCNVIEPFDNKGKLDELHYIKTQTYGTIVLRDVLEHLIDWKKYLTIFDSILKKGGRLLISSPFNDYNPNEDWNSHPHLTAPENNQQNMFDFVRNKMGYKFDGHLDQHHWGIGFVK